MPILTRTKEFTISEVTESADGILWAKGGKTRIQLGTRQHIAARLRDEPDVSLRELFLWALRLARQTDANLSNLAAFQNKTIRITLTMEIVNGS